MKVCVKNSAETEIIIKMRKFNIIQNPIGTGRGWFSIFPFKLSELYDFEEMKWCLKKEESLVLARINIGEYNQMEIPDKALKNFQNIMQFFRKYEKKVILRFVYDETGQGLINEPSSLRIILEHIRQVGSIMEKNSDIILTTQGTFVGSWGEMHTSRYINKENIADVIIALYTATNGTVRMAVRRPSQHRELRSELSARRLPVDEIMSMVSIYDDALMASVDDYGTFDLSDIGADKNYVAKIGESLPVGGEAVNANIENDGQKAILYLKKLHISYLNSQYDLQVLDKWKSEQMSTGISVYDYITKNLGAVLQIRKIKEDIIGKYIRVIIANTGFAALYQDAYLVISNEDGRIVFQSETLKGLQSETDIDVLVKKNILPSNKILNIMILYN